MSIAEKGKTLVVEELTRRLARNPGSQKEAGDARDLLYAGQRGSRLRRPLIPASRFQRPRLASAAQSRCDLRGIIGSFACMRTRAHQPQTPLNTYLPGSQKQPDARICQRDTWEIIGFLWGLASQARNIATDGGEQQG